MTQPRVPSLSPTAALQVAPTSRLALLRARTGEAHERIETVPALSRLIAAGLTRAEYIAVLQHLEAFHAAAEPAIAESLRWLPEAASMLDGSRPFALAEDLAWFGARPLQWPCLARPDGPAAALGALYVIEGSELGGRVIARHLTASLGVSAGKGGSFYCRQTADAARRRWRRLCAILEGPLAEDRAAERMLAGALSTFQALEDWLRSVKSGPETDTDIAAALPTGTA